jgi:hypothetical protein
MTFYQFKEILKRIAATVVMKVSGMLAVGSFAGVEPIKNAAMAAGVGVLEVIEELAKAYKEDGVLTDDEINSAFSDVEEIAPVPDDLA